MFLLKKIFSNQLIKVASLNSISIFIRVLTGIISSKAIAYFIGASGMALMGNFRNFISSIESIGILGLNNGIIKTVAEKSNDREEIYPLITTILYFVFFLGTIIGIVIFVFSNEISNYLFNTIEYSIVIQILAILLPFQILNTVLIIILNGLRTYKKVIILTILTYLIGVILSVYLMWNFKVLGALFSVSILSIIVFFITLYFFSKEISIKRILNFKKFKIELIYKILPLGMMTLFSAVIVPIIYINIRKYIIQFDSLEAAGYYESMNRISGFYMIFITTLINLYFLPELSKAETVKETKSIFIQYYKHIIPIFTLGLVFIFFTRNCIVKLLLTSDFLPVNKLFIWQLLGDLFRSLSLILGIQFFAKKMIKPYFIIEFFSLVILIISSYFCIRLFRVEGAVISYAITYFIYFIVLVFFFKKYLQINTQLNEKR